MALEHPILFSAPMVRAIMAGTKTQTRRLVLPAPVGDVDSIGAAARLSVCRYGQPGDRLWVKETIRRGATTADARIEYRDTATYDADGAATKLDTWPWQRRVLSSIHLPRGLSRITLEVEAVRIQRLQDISEADAQAEGVDPWWAADLTPYGEDRGGESRAYRAGFMDLWQSINAKRAPWSANPWVFAITFRRLPQ